VRPTPRSGDAEARSAERPPTAGAESAPVGIRQPSAYLSRLESLRGVAILLVILHHADRLVLPPDAARVKPSLFYAYIEYGHTGVSLFFVLSAFLLSRPFLRAASAPHAVSALHFWQRRALRILPLYWTMVVVSSCLYAMVHDTTVLRGLPYLVFANSFSGVAERIFPYSDVWWSLATEAQFYLLLPLAGHAIRSRAGRWVVGLLFALYCVDYAQTAHHGFHITKSNAAIGLYGRFPAFAVGIGIAWLYDRHGRRVRDAFESRAWLRRGGADVALIVVVCTLGALLREVAVLDFFTAENRWHFWHVAESLLWGLVVLLVLLAPMKLARACDSRWLQRIGVLSYSLYLVHLPVLFFILYALRGRVPAVQAGWNPTSLAIVGACLALAIGLSSLTYRFIERPFLERKARVAS